MGLKKIALIDLNQDRGGSVDYILSIIPILQEEGFEPLLVVSKKCQWKDQIVISMIKYKMINSYPWVINLSKNRYSFSKSLIKFVINLYSELRLFFILKNFDYIYVNTIIYPSGLLTGLFSKKKTILHIHEYLDLDHNLTFIWKKLSKKLYSTSNLLAANSPNVANHFSLSKYVMIPNGFDYKDYSLKKLTNSKLINLGIVGRIDQTKGHKDLILALPKLQEHNLDFVLNIWGEGDKKYIKTLKTLIDKLDLNSKVIFNGFCKNKFKIFQSIDILCICSRSEAFGRVTIEGLLSGCIVIGSNSGFTPEIIKDGKTGYLYEPYNPDSLATKIIFVNENREKAQIVAKGGYLYSKNEFSLNKTKEALLRALA